MRAEILDLKKDKSELNEKFLELQSRSMQENLLVFGVEENLSNEKSKSEDTERVLKDFMKNNIATEENETDMDDNIFDRVHRLDRPRHDRKGNCYDPSR